MEDVIDSDHFDIRNIISRGNIDIGGKKTYDNINNK